MPKVWAQATTAASASSRIINTGYRVYAHRFTDSCVHGEGEPADWCKVATVDDYCATNLELASVIPEFDLYEPNWPIWTYQEQLSPAKFVFDVDYYRGMVIDSMVSGGRL